MLCHLCGMRRVPLAEGFAMCPRCDTVQQGPGMRAGPPNHAGTRDGWFRAAFGDHK